MPFVKPISMERPRQKPEGHGLKDEEWKKQVLTILSRASDARRGRSDEKLQEYMKPEKGRGVYEKDKSICRSTSHSTFSQDSSILRAQQSHSMT